ncbi:hypothetical protein ACSBOB_00245 [Mesorhizobium sp. ASY16-5R]|uniref:hypothetical protein n=1 Tax=Mesorhizobium sp. ASY16-5R TaxID=3445772 RepID=UPI003F9F52A3
MPIVKRSPSEPSTISGRGHKILLEAIISMQPKPGVLLSEAGIARRMGTSRQPILAERHFELFSD